ncbi:unnamed protein product [Pleuronectes platessa]|uniref:Uncharacterized protein n=1 Tax=Pleuronectes platessa TaxID=8262 RepID=A0A9N7VA56_PLEPL|nr:unnamed protein product [Pleuronectes platessa]
MPHVLEWTQSPKMSQVPLILESQGTQSPRGCNRMLHVLGSGQYHTKVSRTTRVNSYWSLWSKTREVPEANIRRGLPKISLFSHPSNDGRLLQRHSPQSFDGQQAVQPLFSYIAKGGAWLIQLPSLSNPQPERRDVLQENFNQHLSTRLDRIANAELYDHKARRRHRTAN